MNLNILFLICGNLPLQTLLKLPLSILVSLLQSIKDFHSLILFPFKSISHKIYIKNGGASLVNFSE